MGDTIFDIERCGHKLVILLKKMEIKQNRYSDKRFFRLEDDGVYFKIKSPTEDVSGKFKYEDLGLSTLTVRKKEASWVFTIIAMIGMYALRPIIEATQEKSIVDIIFIIIGCLTIFGGLFFLIIETRKELITITDGAKSFSMHRNVPNTTDVDNFISELHQRIRERIITLNVRPNDMKIDEEYKIYQLQNLLDTNVINKQKYVEIEKQIRSQTKSNKIGFKKNSNEEE